MFTSKKCELTNGACPFHYVVKYLETGWKRKVYPGSEGQRFGSITQSNALGYGKAETSWQKGVMGESYSAQAVSESRHEPGLISLTYFHQLDATSFS